MRKQIRKVTSGLLAAGLLAGGLTFGITAYAANEGAGSVGSSADTEYTLEEMLTYAIEDEYLSQTEYEMIMDTYGIQKPFSNIIKAEANHISLLEPLFGKYGISIPKKDWESLVTVPESLETAYSIGEEAEGKNIAMYESFLKEELPDEVRVVFENLMNASKNHLAAFQRQVDGVAYSGIGSCDRTGKGIGNCDGTGNQRGKGMNGIGGNGQGNRSVSQGSCITE
ncbi:MAG TPA: DUF2202 domain-containing protein [Lachnospiraceae bacterium]|nr:DUF2202 domain-containing protein [Lachnospiraceae bacterium]